MKLYDVVIVGGGAVGASLALALGQCGCQVLLIEKENVTFATVDPIHSKTLALSYASAKIYDALGIWSLLQPEVTPIKRVRVSMQGHFGSCLLDHKKQKTDALGYVISANVLEHVLIDQLKNYETIEVLRPAKLLDSQHLCDYWQLSLQQDTEIKTVRCQLLIGSDGVNSPLRQAQYIDCVETSYGHCGIMVNLKMKESLPEEALERFLTTGAIALLPWQRQWVTCVWTAEENEAKQLMGLDDNAFIMKCQQQLGMQYGVITELGKRNIFPLKMKLAKMQTGTRFLLMGNAAHNLHPIAAQGLNLSLRDIWQFRNQIRSIPNEEKDVGAADFLARYLASRKLDQTRVVFATDKIARFMASRGLPEGLRAMGITLFDSFSPLKQWFTRYSMGLG